jgi:hypothetical protein
MLKRGIPLGIPLLFSTVRLISASNARKGEDSYLRRGGKKSDRWAY